MYMYYVYIIYIYICVLAGFKDGNGYRYRDSRLETQCFRVFMFHDGGAGGESWSWYDVGCRLCRLCRL